MPWKWLNSLLKPSWDWIQVEVSTHCNAACIYCPHTVYRDSWIERHMSLTTFKNLVPVFAKTRLVYLQGWGEPFLNPDFFTMVGLAKEAGCRVGTTTNGMPLDAAAIRRLVASGIDLVTFSLAGTDEKNDIRRPGTSLKKVLEAVQALHQAKEELGRPGPGINIAYMLLRSGMADLVRLHQLLQGLGVEQVVISTLDFVPRGELAGETLLPENTQEYEELKGGLRELMEVSKRRGIKVHCQLRDPGEKKLLCPENVQCSLFVGADGSVSPCAFANLPVSRAVYLGRGGECTYQRLILGNLEEHPLPDIWRTQAYANFRRSFFTGKLISICRNCLKM